jgi:hypothetical protein
LPSAPASDSQMLLTLSDCSDWVHMAAGAPGGPQGADLFLHRAPLRLRPCAHAGQASTQHGSCHAVQHLATGKIRLPSPTAPVLPHLAIAMAASTAWIRECGKIDALAAGNGLVFSDSTCPTCSWHHDFGRCCWTRHRIGHAKTCTLATACHQVSCCSARAPDFCR